MLDRTLIESSILIPSLIILLKSKVLACSEISHDRLEQDLKETDIQMDYSIEIGTGYKRFVSLSVTVRLEAVIVI